MFLRTKTVNGHPYLLLVENRWERGRAHQRIVHYFGRRDRLDFHMVQRIVEHFKGIRHLTPAQLQAASRRARGDAVDEIEIEGRQPKFAPGNAHETVGTQIHLVQNAAAEAPSSNRAANRRDLLVQTFGRRRSPKTSSS